MQCVCPCPSTQARLWQRSFTSWIWAMLLLLFFFFFGNISLSLLLWLEESDWKNVGVVCVSIYIYIYPLIEFVAISYVGRVRASMIYHRFICARRDPCVLATPKRRTEPIVWSIDQLPWKRRETDRPTDALFGLCILQGWLGSFHASSIEKVHRGKGW